MSAVADRSQAHWTYGVVAVLASGVMVWTMTAAPDGPQKPWLIAAAIGLAGTVTASWLSPKPFSRGAVFTLAAIAAGVPCLGWLAGAQDGLLMTPFVPLALAFLGRAFTSRQRVAV